MLYTQSIFKHLKFDIPPTHIKNIIIIHLKITWINKRPLQLVSWAQFLYSSLPPLWLSKWTFSYSLKRKEDGCGTERQIRSMQQRWEPQRRRKESGKQTMTELEMQTCVKEDTIQQMLRRHLVIHMRKNVNTYPALQNRLYMGRRLK